MIFIRILITSLAGFIFGFSYSQSYIIKDIKSFGAKGNGSTNDQSAFQKAATFFNQRGGNGKLTISAGTYIIGRQTFTAGKDKKPVFNGEHVLQFVNIKNLSIEGTSKTILKYQEGLHFGAFIPETGKPKVKPFLVFQN